MTKKKKPAPEAKPQDKPHIAVSQGPKDILNEKDREILRDVDKIIWNPDLLKKFKGQGSPMMPDGYTKVKKENSKKEGG